MDGKDPTNDRVVIIYCLTTNLHMTAVLFMFIHLIIHAFHHLTKRNEWR